MSLFVRPLVLALITISLAACGTPDETSGPSPDPPGAGASLAASLTPAASGTPAVSGSAGPSVEPPSPPAAATDPPALALQEVAGGIDEPIGIEPGPEGTLLVQERGGRLVGLDPADGRTWTVVDLGDRVLGEGERGLLGVAIHPEWPDDPRAFVHFSDRDGNTVLSQLGAGEASGPEPTLDPASEVVLLQLEQPFSNHNGGQLAFGPDGHLWMGLGDGGSGGDPLGNGQDPSTLLGSILRLDVGSADAEGYAIPADNPFVDGGGAPEVYHYGLRNPWRFSFDAETGELFIADVGQNAYEEVNRVPADADPGLNFGWNVMEAAHCFADAACQPDGLVLPWVEYGRDLGCSVTGGYVYRGAAIDGLQGWYLFADFCSGLLFGASLDSPTDVATIGPTILLETGAQVAAFGRDAAGELYLADLASGSIYRIVAAD
jgi:glucose/arabinose dehydrogenase